MKKAILVLMMFLFCVTSAAATSGEALASASYLMATSSATGNYYRFGSVLAQIISAKAGVSITVTSSGGSIENARLLGSGENEFALIQTDVNHYALTGTEQFAGKPIRGFSAITALYPEMVQIVVSKKSGIQSVLDMKGKRICVGAAGSGYEVAARQVLLAHGMTYDDIDERFLSASEGKNALQDGQIDAFFMCSGYPNSNVVELGLTGGIDVISIAPEYVKKLTEMYPFYSPYTTPDDDQYKIGHTVDSVSVMAMLVARDDVPEDVIYNVTKVLYENLDEIRLLNSRGNYMTLEGAFRGIGGNVHPGAARFYREKGMTVPSKDL